MSLPSEGDLVDGRYRIERAIGQGAMGAVYAVLDERSQRRYALKWIALDGLTGDAEQIRGWAKREIKALQVLQHPAILQLYDHGTAEDALFVVTELLQGRDLLAVVEQQGPLSPQECARVGAGLCDALAAAHAQGIVHRDVKPGNLFQCGDGRFILLDFGIAKASDTSRQDTMARSAGTLLAGTASFLAPERIAGAQAQPPSDVFSAGGTLQWLLTAKLPFPGATLLDVLKAIAAGKRQPIERKDLPPQLTELLAAMMAQAPEDRPTAAQAAQTLSELGGSGHTQMLTVASTAPSAPPEPEETDESPTLWWLALPVVLAVPIVAIWLYLHKPAPPVMHEAPLVQAPEPAALPPPSTPDAIAPVAKEEAPPPAHEPARQGTAALSFEHWVELSVDGLTIGRKEFSTRLALTPGKHTIVATHPRFGTKTYTLDIKPGRTQTLHIDLAK